MWLQFSNTERVTTPTVRPSKFKETFSTPLISAIPSMLPALNGPTAVLPQVVVRDTKPSSPLSNTILDIPDPIFIVYGNAGYRHVLGSFVCNMQLFPEMRSHLLVVVTDHSTAGYIREIDHEITVFVDENGLNGAYLFGTTMYIELMLARGAFLIESLHIAQDQSKSVIWIEPDFDYRQNLMHRTEITHTQSDLVFFKDHQMFCGCFIRFAPVPASVTFYEEVMNRTRGKLKKGVITNDQEELNAVVQEQAPNYTVFDRCLYRSGLFKRNEYILENEQACTDSHIVVQHHNWIVGVESKIQMAKESGAWFLSADLATCNQRGMLLVVMTMNRPASLERLINSLKTAHYAQGDSIDLRITVDRDYNGNIHTETMAVLKDVDWPYGIFEVIVWPKKIGLYGQWIHSWPAEKYSDDLYKAVVLLEDDLEVSPFYANWFIGAHKNYGQVVGVGGVTGQRPNLVAAVGGPATVKSEVPEGTKAFGYLLMATWSLSPVPRVWREFRQWVTDKRENSPDFIPSVPGIIPDQWYEHFRSRGEEENMWEMWFIRFADERKLHTVYPWVGNGDQTIVGNWMEAGLHFSGTPALDFTITQEWDDGLLLQTPLPLVGYDLKFPPAPIEQQCIPVFPPELLNVMKSSCISETCRVLSTTPANELPQVLAQLGGRQDDKERHGHWIEQEVLDISNAIIHSEGDVDVCNDTGYVQKDIGSRGCKTEDLIHLDQPCSSSLSSPPVAHDQVIVISQMWGGAYFHALVEGLPRLALALEYLNSLSLPHNSWEVHSMINGHLAIQLTDMFGVQNFIHGHTYAKRVLIPAPTACGGSLGGKSTILLSKLINMKIRRNIQIDNQLLQKNNPSILIVIKRTGARALKNHNEIVEKCKSLWKAGNVVEHLGEGSLLEQFTLFHSASVVLGPHGAGLANSIAMQEKSIMIEVLPETGSNRLNMCYAALAYTLHLRYFAVRAQGFDSDGEGIVQVRDLEPLPVWS
jgi:hypothetical protein